MKSPTAVRADAEHIILREQRAFPKMPRATPHNSRNVHRALRTLLTMRLLAKIAANRALSRTIKEHARYQISDSRADFRPGWNTDRFQGGFDPLGECHAARNESPAPGRPDHFRIHRPR